MSSSVTVTPRLPEGRIGRGVSSSSSSFYQNTPSSGGTDSDSAVDTALNAGRPRPLPSARSKRSSSGALFCESHHPLCVVQLLVEKVRVHHDVHIGRWTSPPHNTVLIAHQRQPLHPLLLPCVWPLLPDEGGGVKHTGERKPGRRSAACGIAFCFAASRGFREPPSGWRRLVRSFLDP